MFTITNRARKNGADIITADTMEDLRTAIVEEAFRHGNLDYLSSKYEDQFCAVRPYDKSELDEGKKNPVPRPLTRELIEQLAADLWGAPYAQVVLREEKTRPLGELVTELAASEDMSGAVVMATLLEQIGQRYVLNRREIDEEAICDTDAASLMAEFRVIRKGGSLGLDELGAVDDAAAGFKRAKEDYLRAREVRNSAIVEAVRAGADRKAVASAGGVTYMGVKDIVKKYETSHGTAGINCGLRVLS